MAQPGLAAQHYDAVLTNISVAYMQAPDNFIARQVFPVVPTDKQSGIYFKYNQGDWLRDEAKKRAPATQSAGSGYSVGQDNYFCDVYAFHKDVDEQTIANATSPFQPMSDSTKFVASRLALRQEVDFANTYFKTGVWANDFVGHASTNTGSNFIQFSNYSTSTPIESIDRAKATLNITGYEINTMVVGRAVFDKLKNHPAIIDRIKYTSSDVITEQILARYFGVQKFLVAKAIVNTAAEGQPDVIVDLFGDSILMTHSAAAPGLLTPSAGYTFAWNQLGGLEVSTYQIPMPLEKATRIESQNAWSNKVVAPNLGVFLSDVIA
jgi:Phage major capsid protein E